MQIELIGCTGAGKSTLAQQLVKAHRQNGLQLVTSYEFVLGRVHLNWVRPHRARMLILNLAALLACLLTWRKNLPFFRFVFGVIMRLPARVGWAEKLKIARIALRNVGIDEVVRGATMRSTNVRGVNAAGVDAAGARPAQPVILADEGTLHIANYLFVHASLPPDLSALSTFLGLVALPDAAAYLRQPRAVLVDRTRARGHGRIPRDEPALVEPFIHHSLAVFEHLTAHPAIASRLVILDDGQVTSPTADPTPDPRLAFARRLFDLKSPTPPAGTAPVRADLLTPASPRSTQLPQEETP